MFFCVYWHVLACTEYVTIYISRKYLTTWPSCANCRKMQSIPFAHHSTVHQIDINTSFVQPIGFCPEVTNWHVLWYILMCIWHVFGCIWKQYQSMLDTFYQYSHLRTRPLQLQYCYSVHYDNEQYKKLQWTIKTTMPKTKLKHCCNDKNFLTL